MKNKMITLFEGKTFPTGFNLFIGKDKDGIFLNIVDLYFNIPVKDFIDISEIFDIISYAIKKIPFRKRKTFINNKLTMRTKLIKEKGK